MRVQKLIANAGLMSRRQAEEAIKEGRVSVNGKIITIGDQAEHSDTVTVDGKKVHHEQKRYILLNKPKGYICSTDDRHGKTILGIMPIKERIFPVGRLDKDTTGAIILTNDGDFANHVMHPRYETKKTYLATVDKEITDLTPLKRITIEGKPIKVEYNIRDKKTLELTIHEGKKHIVKRMLFKIGFYVTSLKRIKIGSVSLGKLASGKFRDLTKQEIESFVTKSVKSRRPEKVRTTKEKRHKESRRTPENKKRDSYNKQNSKKNSLRKGAQQSRRSQKPTADSNKPKRRQSSQHKKPSPKKEEKEVRFVYKEPKPRRKRSSRPRRK